MAYVTSGTSSPLRFLVQKKIQIRLGPPIAYRLPTEKRYLDENPMVQRWTFGERDLRKMNKTILLVGETGTGKTSIINTLVNYLLGIKWEDKVWFDITEEVEVKLSETKTTNITVYEVFVEENPICLTIIDTPGYGYTRGMEYDLLIAENLNKLFRSEDEVRGIDAIGLVVRSTQNRLTASQRYIFDAILSLFGKDLEKNIVLFVTHSDGKSPKNVLAAISEGNILCAKNQQNQPEHFLFDNCQPDLDKDFESLHKSAWNMGMQSVEKLFNFLKTTDKKNLRSTRSVLRERKQLEICIGNLEERINAINLKECEMAQIDAAMEQNRQDLETCEKLQFEVDEPYKEKVDTGSNPKKSKKVTSCDTCQENCHFPSCSEKLKSCKAMKKKYCTVCTGKCHYSKHTNEAKMYIQKTRKVMKINEELKTKYEEEYQEKVELKNQVESELDALQEEKSQLMEEAYQSILTLERIALKSDSLSTLLHLDFIIDILKEAGNSEKVQSLQELKTTEEANDAAMVYLRVGLGRTERSSQVTNQVANHDTNALETKQQEQDKTGIYEALTQMKAKPFETITAGKMKAFGTLTQSKLDKIMARMDQEQQKSFK
ncbi:hypothetical protein AALO_G00300220 [Alosa alosa]|uniref:AIG1-type G domain-containing protein n=1 Tax=Alosa alosa TaxID=278164 RepID=A0AAV6FIY1_9TELE|nr:uncharacterized protein LOC125289695 [Alosa alosa]KAG5261117.1 hypothetical protein AALO_G00300220 [Alosa alosa]